MQLTYRGISYTSSPATVTTTPSTTTGNYRGTTFQFNQAMVTQPSHKANLTYRGVSYLGEAVNEAVSLAADWEIGTHLAIA